MKIIIIGLALSLSLFAQSECEVSATEEGTFQVLRNGEEVLAEREMAGEAFQKYNELVDQKECLYIEPRDCAIRLIETPGKLAIMAESPQAFDFKRTRISAIKRNFPKYLMAYLHEAAYYGYCKKAEQGLCELRNFREGKAIVRDGIAISRAIKGKQLQSILKNNINFLTVSGYCFESRK